MHEPSAVLRPFLHLSALLVLSALPACDGCADTDDTDVALDGDAADVAAVDAADGSAPEADGGGSDTDSSVDPPTDTEPSGDTAADGGPEADTSPTDSGPRDTTGGDTARDTATADTAPRDSAPADTTRRDSALHDTAASNTGHHDTDSTDTSTPDTASRDTGPTPPPGLSTPCSNGSGWTLLKFHWGSRGRRSPSIDVWDAACSYSTRINDACGAFLIRNPRFTNRTNVPILTRSKTILTRFKVVPSMGFTRASVHIKARSYDTTSSTKFEAWSPLYGSRESAGLVGNDFTYDWHSLDWTGHLKPGDPHGKTAIEIRDAAGGSGELAVEAVEVCVE